MRHLRSILYTLVLAPTVWVLCGMGFTGDLVGQARASSDTLEELTGLMLLLSAGSAYAILLLAPISPAGPLLGGLTFFGVGLWALALPSSYATVWPESVRSDLSLPGYGLALVLAVPMICTALSARRWAAYEAPVLPLIGTVGRGDGDERTAVLNVPAVRDAEVGPPSGGGEPDRFDDEVTTLLAGATPAAGSDSAERDRDEEATTVLPAQVVDASANEAEPDAAGASNEAVVEEPSAEGPTETVEVSPSAAVSEDSEERTQLLTPPTTEQPATEQPATEQPTADMRAATAEVRPPDEQPTVDVQAESATADIRSPDERPTGEILAGRPARDFGPGEKTQVIARNPGETTQIVRQTTAAIYPPPGETTRSITPAADTVEPPAERTQLITSPAEEPTTQPSISGAERPDPGADPTTRLPQADAVTKAEAEAVTKAEETTADQRGPAGETTQERPSTILNLERPQDEAAEDTRPITVPTQRTPADD